MRTSQTIEYSEAKRIIDLIVERALQMQKAAVIAVADSHGELIAFARMDGAPISSIRIAANKAWTAARERPQALTTQLSLFQLATLGFSQILFVGSSGNVRQTSVCRILGLGPRAKHATN